MKHVRRLLAGIASGLISVVMIGGVAVPAAAASKKQLKIVYVDDTPGNNGSVSCPHTPYTTIEQGLAAIGSVKKNVTLNICRGFYYPVGTLTFNGFTNLKIVGKGDPIITSPPGFDGGQFQILDSTKVLVQGLNITGAGNVGGTYYAAAIYIYNTSGIVRGNTVSAWHSPYSGSPPVNVPSQTYGISNWGVYPAAKVTISGNTIYDVQDYGIFTRGPGVSKILKNRVVFSSAVNPLPDEGSYQLRVQAGIVAFKSAPGNLVYGNQIESDADLYPQNTNSRGILLFETSGAKIRNNTIRGTAAQISIEGYCGSAGSNLINRNKLYDSFFIGVRIVANAIDPDCSVPHTDNNKVLNNKIYTGALNSSLYPVGAFLLASGGVVDGNTVRNNTFAGYLSGNEIVSIGATNSVLSPNKFLVVPPAGPQAAAASDAAASIPPPLPPVFLIDVPH